jgi:hypothetical protein
MSPPGDMLKATEKEEPTVTTTTWDGPAWAHIEAAGPGLPGLMATLQATTAACDATIGLGEASPAIDPFAGWANTTGILAGLVLATHTTPPSDPAPLDTPPSDDAAATVIDRLYRTAADQALTLGLELRDQLPTLTTGGSDPHALPVLEALAATMSLLAAAYTETFGRPW